MVIQALITLFVLFAVSRVWLRYRDGSISVFGTIIWTLLWTGLVVVVWDPNITNVVARLVGVGRGIDALIYFSIVALFYVVFRLYVKMEFVEREITSLVRKLALKDEEVKHSAP